MVKVERRPINHKMVRDFRQDETPTIEVMGKLVNKSNSGKALQLDFKQYGVERVWLPIGFCAVNDDDTVVVRLPGNFRSRLDSSQRVRINRLIKQASAANKKF